MNPYTALPSRVMVDTEIAYNVYGYGLYFPGK